VKRDLPIEIARAARRDLTGLWLKYADISEELADRISARIEITIEELGRHPEMGRLRPELPVAGLRSVAVNPHIIFYAITPSRTVRIHRVVDGRRNLAAVFLSDGN
jgi:plasmid stabilization system protein ParE